VNLCDYAHCTNLVNINYKFVYFAVVIWLVVVGTCCEGKTHPFTYCIWVC